ncbi:MAG: hypothetical protein Q9227_001875 [Pyrenula ochraceoflavens]
MEILRDTPKAEDFIPLAEHQSATPASFHSGPAILYHHGANCKLSISEDDLRLSSALNVLQSSRAKTQPAPTVNGDAPLLDGVSSDQVLEGIDVWVTSQKLLFYSTLAATGVSIPYPSISLHAIQSLPQPSPGEEQGLYMQLINFSSDEGQQSEEDEDLESISLTIVPPAMPQQAQTTDDEERSSTPIQALFNALSECSNLHPDPATEEIDNIEESTLFQNGLIAPGADTGGLPPPFPGSGGWITAENMHQYFDEDGNWIGGEGTEETEALGPGAGHTRSRDNAGDDGENGQVEETDETKWRRTD